ncbi:MAG: hypothetical protein ACHQQQ_01675 [Bacteroidota bacterium]
MIHKVKAVASDFIKVISRTRDLIRYAREVDSVPASISIFSCDKPTVRLNQISEYRLILANNSPQDFYVKILIDIYRKEHPVHPEGHFAYFSKSLYLPKMQPLTITVAYDWNREACIVIDDAQCSPEEFWRGTVSEKGVYYINASLYHGGDKSLERLMLAQELAG